jgi:hypothetical protein
MGVGNSRFLSIIRPHYHYLRIGVSGESNAGAVNSTALPTLNFFPRLSSKSESALGRAGNENALTIFTFLPHPTSIFQQQQRHTRNQTQHQQPLALAAHCSRFSSYNSTDTRASNLPRIHVHSTKWRCRRTWAKRTSILATSNLPTTRSMVKLIASRKRTTCSPEQQHPSRNSWKQPPQRSNPNLRAQNSHQNSKPQLTRAIAYSAA